MCKDCVLDTSLEDLAIHVAVSNLSPVSIQICLRERERNKV